MYTVSEAPPNTIWLLPEEAGSTALAPSNTLLLPAIGGRDIYLFKKIDGSA
jgi:hypothetical protein